MVSEGSKHRDSSLRKKNWQCVDKYTTEINKQIRVLFIEHEHLLEDELEKFVEEDVYTA